MMLNDANECKLKIKIDLKIENLSDNDYETPIEAIDSFGKFDLLERKCTFEDSLSPILTYKSILSRDIDLNNSFSLQFSEFVSETDSTLNINEKERIFIGEIEFELDICSLEREKLEMIGNINVLLAMATMKCGDLMSQYN